MKKMSKIIIALIMVIIAIMLLNVMFYDVKATGTITLNDLEISGGTTTNTNSANTTGTNSTTTNTTTNTTKTNTQTTTNTKTNNVGNTLPKTGITEDITVMFFIVVCIVSAIYAYKKIRDYKA